MRQRDACWHVMTSDENTCTCWQVKVDYDEEVAIVGDDLNPAVYCIDRICV
jgi:hypothetical protein